MDSNGNAQGITVFVATKCNSNEHLSSDQQDPRYTPDYLLGSALEGLSDEIVTAVETEGAAPTENEYTAAPEPPILPTCLRGCLCGYSATSYNDAIDLYTYCDCEGSLAHLFVYLAKSLPDANNLTIYTTPTNLSLLRQYDVDFDVFNAKIANYSYFHEDAYAFASWVNISEGSNLTLQKGFEWFGDYETISDVI